eukprot:TRINITY_DN52662_c0_g1_i1.p1 TRINITY_DN52662_c0_g1~~TRINITY_DN52662_c0_g1_i1.p1  ORF type:complete len:498 (-),score=62.18 TRINITY_DN52662_c0_g1_i1:153-1646(-)
MEYAVGRTGPTAADVAAAFALTEVSKPATKAALLSVLPKSIPSGAFVVLFMNWPLAREGVDLIIRAWVELFNPTSTSRMPRDGWPRREAHLIMKLGYFESVSHAEFEQWLRRLAPGIELPQNIHLIARYLTEDEVAALEERTDLYVEPWRQGGCLSITAMRMLRRGKLVVASAHNVCTGCRMPLPFNQSVENSSGLLDTEAYGPISANIQGYYDKNVYYEPSVRHLQERILEVWRASRTTLSTVGSRAVSSVAFAFDSSLVAEQLDERLNKIVAFIDGGGVPPRLDRPWLIDQAGSLRRAMMPVPGPGVRHISYDEDKEYQTEPTMSDAVGQLRRSSKVNIVLHEGTAWKRLREMGETPSTVDMARTCTSKEALLERAREGLQQLTKAFFTPGQALDELSRIEHLCKASAECGLSVEALVLQAKVRQGMLPYEPRQVHLVQAITALSSAHELVTRLESQGFVGLDVAAAWRADILLRLQQCVPRRSAFARMLKQHSV